MMQVISFSSGKGGVGKTTLTANLGVLWAKSGQRTLMIDGDWGLGKLGLLFGSRPSWTLDRVLEGDVSLDDALHPVQDNLWMLGAPSGRAGFEELSEAMRHQVFYEIDALKERFDRILFDHSSGLHSGVLPFVAASHKHVIVTTTEPTSYTDAYAIMKILSTRFRVRDFFLVVTMSQNEAESRKIISRFIDVAQSHLTVRVELLDILKWEPRVTNSIRLQRPFVELFSETPFTGKLKGMQTRLDQAPLLSRGGLKFFTSLELKDNYGHTY